jgi:branched-chain amino acid aminotransferase
LEIDLPYTPEQIDDAKREALDRAGLESAYIRPVIFRGSRQMGISVTQADIQFAIAVWHWGDYFDNKLKGIRLSISEWQRPPRNCAPVDAKAAGLYMICTLAKKAAEEAGYADALMLDSQGNVAEATGANIFLVRDGEIHTPRPDCFLNGITRQTVIELAHANGYRIIERPIRPDELSTFAECFITGSAAEVTPVVQIGPHNFRVGDISRKLVEAYDMCVREPGRRFGAARLESSGSTAAD